MNALIHSFDRIEPSAQRGRLSRFVRATWAGFAKALRAWQERRAIAGLYEWDDRLLRDIGLSRNEVRGQRLQPLSDGRWLIDHNRLGER